MHYLNHAGTSWPKPPAVRAAITQALEAPAETWPDVFSTQHRVVATALGISDPTRLLLTPGCTSALNVALLDHPWQPGDTVLTSAWEHHALHRPILELEKRGIQHAVIPPQGTHPIDLDQLERKLRNTRTRLVAITAASNVTGALLPIDDIIRLAHAHQALVLIDGAQTTGWLDLDLDALRADLFTFAGHKGPQAPWGIGGLYVAPTTQMMSPLAHCEIPQPGEPQKNCAPMPGYCDTGSVDRLALAGLAAGFTWLATQSRRLDKARQQITRLREAIEQIPAIKFHGPENPDERVPTIAFTVEGRDLTQLNAALHQHGIIASAGLQCAPMAHQTLGTAPDGVIRLSVGPTTTDDAIAACAASLTKALG